MEITLNKNTVKDFEYISYPYSKYGETVLSIKLPQGNFQILNLSQKYLTNGTFKGYEETKDFCEEFGKRICYLLNKYKGKTLDEIHQKEGE